MKVLLFRGDTQGYQTLTLAVIWKICEDLVLAFEPRRPKWHFFKSNSM